MAFVDETQRSALLQRAFDALAEKAPEIYREIVETLSKLCNKNQKEIAGELQQLSKAIEARGSSEQAFEFKQRTCAVMLEISMEDRRRKRDNDGSAAELTNFNPVDSIEKTARSSANGLGADTGELDVIKAEPYGHRNFDQGAQHDNNEFAKGSYIAVESTRLQSSQTSIDSALPFLSVEYLYMGSADYDRDLLYYLDVLGAQEVWKFDRFGSRITALSLSAGPLILLADHRTAPSCQPVFRVSDLSATARDLAQRGWKPVAGPFGTPNGEAYSFEDPSGNRFAIFQVDETSTDRAYYDPTDND